MRMLLLIVGVLVIPTGSPPASSVPLELDSGSSAAASSLLLVPSVLPPSPVPPVTPTSGGGASSLNGAPVSPNTSSTSLFTNVTAAGTPHGSGSSGLNTPTTGLHASSSFASSPSTHGTPALPEAKDDESGVRGLGSLGLGPRGKEHRYMAVSRDDTKYNNMQFTPFDVNSKHYSTFYIHEYSWKVR